MYACLYSLLAQIHYSIIAFYLWYSSVCHGYLALKELGRNITEENTKMYDGSWTEWSKEEDLPKILPTDYRIKPS